MDLRILIAAGALVFSGCLYAQDNVAAGKPVSLIGHDFFYDYSDQTPADPNFPQTVVDNNFFDEGHDWNQGTVWWNGGPTGNCHQDDGGPCMIGIDLQGPHRIDSLVFQGDGNDVYSLQYRDMATDTWIEVWKIGASPDGGGLRTRATPEGYSKLPIVTDGLRVLDDFPSCTSGCDTNFSVSEVQAFGAPFDPNQDGVLFSCDDYPGGKFREYLGNETFCYQADFHCPKEGWGSFNVSVNLADGGVGFDGLVGTDPEQHWCAVQFAHLGNTGFSHTCEFDKKNKAELKVKAVNGDKCLDN